MSEFVPVSLDSERKAQLKRYKTAIQNDRREFGDEYFARYLGQSIAARLENFPQAHYPRQALLEHKLFQYDLKLLNEILENPSLHKPYLEAQLYYFRKRGFIKDSPMRYALVKASETPALF